MNEIDALGRFRSHLDEPDPDALARARARALGGQATQNPPHQNAAARRLTSARRARLLAPAIAAAAVTATLVGVSLTTLSSPSTPGNTPGAPTGTVSTTASAAALIEDLAHRIEVQPAAPDSDGMLIEITVTRSAGTGAPAVEVYHAEPNGLIKVDHPEHGNTESYQLWVQQQRDQLATNGPSILQPTPDWLADLDAEPSHLRQLYLAALCATCPPGDETDYQIWSATHDLIWWGGIILPPDVLAGNLRLLASMPAVTAEQATIRGQTAIAIGYLREGRIDEFYVDANTGTMLGTGSREATADGTRHVEALLTSELAADPGR